MERILKYNILYVNNKYIIKKILNAIFQRQQDNSRIFLKGSD